MNNYAPEIRLARFLQFTALVNGLLYLFSLVGAYQSSPTWIEPPFVSNAVASLSLLALLAWFASGDVRRWRTIIHLLVVGFTMLCCRPQSGGHDYNACRGNGLLAFLRRHDLVVGQRSTCARRPLDALDAG